MKIGFYFVAGTVAATCIGLIVLGLNTRQGATNLETIEIKELRKQICVRNLPIEAFRQVNHTPTMAIPKRKNLSVYNEGVWRMASTSGAQNIGNPIDWTAETGMNRSEKWSFHAWRPLQDVLVYYSYEGDSELLDWAISQSVSYANGRFFANNDYRVDKSGDYTWYDMAAGLRARYLAVLLHGASCRMSVSDADFELLFHFAADHVNYLSNERYFVSQNNHGAYQSFGLVYLCRLISEIPNCVAGAKTGEARLKNYFDKRVKDGILLEHSPYYHIFLIQMLGQFLENPEVFSTTFLEGHKQLLRDMLATADMFQTSNNTFVQFGDTSSPNKDFRAVERACLSLDLQRDCVSANAKSSVKKFVGNRVEFFAPDAGYVGFREPVDIHAENGTYLMLTAAFHSRVHKHSDDLSFVWSDLGYDILTDAGMFGYSRLPDRKLSAKERELGYYYSDPKRIYVESIHAHNSVEINGISPPRAKVPFFGAGELEIREEGELIIVRGIVPRYDTDKGAHTRWLVSKPGSFLLVKDHIHDNSKATRQFTVWHHFKPTFSNAYIQRDQISVEQKGLALTIWPVAGEPKDIRLVRGQTEPRLQGWRSETYKKLTPSYALGIDFESSVLDSSVIFSLNGAVSNVDVADTPTGSKYSVHGTDGNVWEFTLD